MSRPSDLSWAETLDAAVAATEPGSGVARPSLEALAVVDPARYVDRVVLTEGGMGRIVAAYDRRLRRQVVLKEILLPLPELQLRFLREIMVTARLQHPSIVSIHEAGRWPSGEPFYAMKLVAGRSLDQAIAERSSLDTRLTLLPHVIAVADALAYAHQQRVIHRDLKPQNVMVGEFGETVVIDWGLAKDLAASPTQSVSAPPASAALDGSETTVGDVLGTPAYMPPEQAAGQPVDERADVYAIGAILYHVLAGGPPYEAMSNREVLALARAGSPQPLHERQQGVPVDLLAVVERAMAADPARRYPTARELAEDLRRFQVGQLVGAHHYTLGQLTRRWLRQHRAPVLVAIGAMVLLVALSAVGVWRIVREQHRAEAERQLAYQQRAEAEDLLDFMLFDLNDKLQPIGKLGLLDVVARKISAYYARQPEGSLETELHKRVTALSNLGAVLEAQGDSAGALATYRAAQVTAEKLASAYPASAAGSRDLASVHINVGEVLRSQGNTADALGEFRAAVALGEQQVAVDFTDGDWQHQLSHSHRKVGTVLQQQGDTAGALAEYRTALALAEKLVAVDPGQIDWRLTLAADHRHVGSILKSQGDLAGADAEFRASLAVQEGLVASDPANTRFQLGLSFCHVHLGEILAQQGKASGALAELRAALAITESLVEKDASNTTWQYQLASNHGQVGSLLLQQGNVAGAISECRGYLAITERLVAKDPTNALWLYGLADAHVKVGDVLLKQGDVAGALAEYRAQLAVAETVMAKDPNNAISLRELSTAHSNLGDVLLKLHDPRAALVEYRVDLGIAERLAAKDPSSADCARDVATSHTSVATALLAGGEAQAAVVELRAALAIVEKLSARDPGNADWLHDVGANHRYLGDALRQLRDRPGSLAELRVAAVVAEKAVALDPTNLEWVQELAELRRRVQH